MNSQERIFIPPQIFGVLLCQLTGGSPAFLGVGGGQLDTEPLFLNFKGKAALLVIVGLLAEIGVLAGVFSQPIFEVGVVSHDLGNIAILVEKNACCFLLLGKSCFHRIPPIFMNFCRLYSHESGWIFQWRTPE